MVCLSTQSSADRLYWLADQAAVWQGAVSVAVYAPDIDFVITYKMIEYLRNCHSNIAQNFIFHIVYPKKYPSLIDYTEIDIPDCSSAELYNKRLVETYRSNVFIKRMKYEKHPQNMLRNIARKYCSSDFVFTPDIDMIASNNLYQQLKYFLTTQSAILCKKCAYVLPVYETLDTIPFPSNKKELVSLIEKGTAREFHIQAFAQNQANSNLPLWANYTYEIESTMEVIYNITSWEEYWEPIYIADSNVPEFDERFVGYGFTRNTQVSSFVYESNQISIL